MHLVSGPFHHTKTSSLLFMQVVSLLFWSVMLTVGSVLLCYKRQFQAKARNKNRQAQAVGTELRLISMAMHVSSCVLGNKVQPGYASTAIISRFLSVVHMSTQHPLVQSVQCTEAHTDNPQPGVMARPNSPLDAKHAVCSVKRWF
jgi:hypothetical protein